jgi:hypothetical protein
MRRRLASLGCAVLLLAGAARGVAESSFPDLNIDELKEQAGDYRHRAELLRKKVGLRNRDISAAESRANAAIQSAQADAEARAQQAAAAQASAQSAAAVAGGVADLLGAFGGNSYLNTAVRAGLHSGGNAAVAGADAAAQAAAEQGSAEIMAANKAAAPLREQAKLLEGEKKRLALKADQYEELADSKDLLIAAETLRKEAEENVRSAAEADKAIAAARSLIENMDVW